MFIKALRRKNHLLIIAAMIIGVFGVSSIGVIQAASTNDIIYGGISNEAELKQAYDNGDGRNSASNIRAIYREAIGVTDSSQFNGMEPGYAHRDGRVTVDGETVATNANSSGRHNFRNSKPLGDTGAYYHRTDVRFSEGTDRVAVLVQTDQKGEYQFAVIKNCGNPVIAEPVKVPEPEPEKEPEPEPEPQAAFACKDLSADRTHIEEGEEVTFQAAAEVENTEITGYVFHFGDGETEETDENTVTHSYETAGTHTAYVIIETDDGDTERVSKCEVDIKVKEKPEPEPEPEPEKGEPEELPSTGFGSGLLGLLGSGAMGVGVRGWFRSRKSLFSELLEQ